MPTGRLFYIKHKASAGSVPIQNHFYDINPGPDCLNRPPSHRTRTCGHMPKIEARNAASVCPIEKKGRMRRHCQAIPNRDFIAACRKHLQNRHCPDLPFVTLFLNSGDWRGKSSFHDQTAVADHPHMVKIQAKKLPEPGRFQG